MRRSGLALFTFLFSFTSIAFADACIPTKIILQKNDLILPSINHPHTAILYLIKNTSPQSLFINHVSKTVGAHAGWFSYLQPGHWSALVVDQKDFSLSCSMVRPGHVVALNCSHVLFICTQATQKPLKGHYWLDEDKPWEKLRKGNVSYIDSP